MLQAKLAGAAVNLAASPLRLTKTENLAVTKEGWGLSIMDASSLCRSARLLCRLEGLDAKCVFDLRDEHLAVSYFAVSGSRDDAVQHAVKLLIGHHDFQHDLGNKVDDIFGSAIGFGLTTLPAVALNISNCHVETTKLHQRLVNFF